MAITAIFCLLWGNIEKKENRLPERIDDFLL